MSRPSDHQHDSSDSEQPVCDEGRPSGISGEPMARLAQAFADPGRAERFQHRVSKLDFSPLLLAFERMLLPKIELPVLYAFSDQVRQQFAAVTNLSAFDTSAFEQLAKASTINFPKIEYPDFGR